MNHTDKTVWFPAKKYGWGWGLPVAWQGWVVMIVYCLLVGLGIAVFDLETQIGWYLLCFFSITVLLIAICWAKGERPRWRWGGD